MVRSHGGVILRDKQSNTPVAFRSSTQTHQKMRIGKAAAELIGSARTLFIDASTTASCLANCIKDREGLTIVTNSLRVADLLAESPSEVWCTGGKLLRYSLAFLGKQALDNVSNFCVDIAFFSSSALGVDGVIQDYSPDETEIRKAVLQTCTRKIFLCDSSKFGQHSPFRVCNLTDVDTIVTDTSLPQELQNLDRFSLLEQNDVCIYTKKK